MTGSLVGNIDVAQVVLYAFWIFFAGLIWYLRQEDRREGYPLEEDVSGRYNKSPWLFVPPKKTFVLPHGQGIKLRLQSGPQRAPLRPFRVDTGRGAIPTQGKRLEA